MTLADELREWVALMRAKDKVAWDGADVWRVGRKVPINVYEGGRPVCQCHTAYDASNICASRNTLAASLDVMEAIANPRYEWHNEISPLTERIRAWCAAVRQVCK